MKCNKNSCFFFKTSLLIVVTLLFSCGEKRQGTNESLSNRKTPDKLTSQHIEQIAKSYKPKIGSHGGTITMAMNSDPDVLCQLLSSTVYGIGIGQIIFEPLIRRDPVTLGFIPHIAKKWESSEDGLTWTFYLRDDVYFTDLVQLTAHDVVFTVNEVIYNEKNHSNHSALMKINNKKFNVTALDDHTVQFKLPSPFAPFLEVAAIPVLPKHVYEKPAKQGKLETFLHAGKPMKNFIGSSAFILDKVELGQRIVFRKNPAYWKKDAKGQKLPYLDEIVFLIIPDANTRMLKFQNGEIDQYALPGGEQYSVLKPLEKEKNYTVYRVGPAWRDGFFLFNQNNQKDPKSGKYFVEEMKQKWFQNKNFRKASTYAINYPEIINIVYNGLAIPSTGVFGRHRGYFHNPKAPQYEYNPEKAKTILAQEGFKDTNGDTFLEDKNGNTVEFTITTMAGDKISQKLYEMIKKDLEKIGFKTHIQFVEFNVLIGKFFNTYAWDMAGLNFGGPITDPHFNKSFFMSKSFQYAANPPIRDAKGNPLPKSETPWEERINSIFELAATETDRSRRKRLYDEWQEKFMEECSWTFLPQSEVILAVNNRIENIHISKACSMTGSMLHNLDEIYIKEAH